MGPGGLGGDDLGSFFGFYRMWKFFCFDFYVCFFGVFLNVCVFSFVFINANHWSFVARLKFIYS